MLSFVNLTTQVRYFIILRGRDHLLFTEQVLAATDTFLPVFFDNAWAPYKPPVAPSVSRKHRKNLSRTVGARQYKHPLEKAWKSRSPVRGSTLKGVVISNVGVS